MSTSETIYHKIFASYMALPKELASLRDSEIRHPQVLIELAGRMGLLPPPERTIRVTGSKGKGTVSRYAARMIQAIRPECRVGLVVSPEELIHRDRMRINEEIISDDAFVTLFGELEPHLADIDLRSLARPYLSPSGLFLLMALLWFKREKVDYFVIETGRGVLFDEAGNIPSSVAVVTSILGEHLDKIGPTLRDVALDKLAITFNSDHVVIDEPTASYALSENLAPFLESTLKKKLILAQHTEKKDMDFPYWITRNHALAWSAVQKLLGAVSMPVVPLASPSFFTFTLDDTPGTAEGLISLSSLDTDYYSKLLKGARDAAVVLSIPDNKELTKIATWFTEELGITPYHVTLSATGLTYHETRETYEARTLLDCTRDEDHLLQKLHNHPALRSARHLSLLGTQSFLRLVKKSTVTP